PPQGHRYPSPLRREAAGLRRQAGCRAVSRRRLRPPDRGQALKRLLCALALAAFAVVGTAGPAFADALSIRSVDTTKFPTVVISALVTGPAPNLADFHLRENG